MWKFSLGLLVTSMKTTRIMLAMVITGIISVWYFSYRISQLKHLYPMIEHVRTFPLHTKLATSRPQTFDGVVGNSTGKPRPAATNSSGSRERSNKSLTPSVLVVVERTDLMYNLKSALEANHIDFATVLATAPKRRWPTLENEGTGKFSVIIFESILSYNNLDKHLLLTIHQYCMNYSVGIIAFALQTKSTRKLSYLPVYVNPKLSLRDLVISPTACDVLHITKAGQRINGSLPYSSWTGFTTNHSSYRHIVQAKSQKRDSNSIDSPSIVLHTTMLLDEGLYDGIQRIFIGNDLKFWLHYILFLDSISYLSHGLMQKSLDRYIQVDIDDIFVGKKNGNRVTTSDVEALMLQQQVLATKIPGFTFKLGFSGRLFGHGNEDEMKGDKALVENAHVFSWFPHMWSHTKAHTYDNQSKLVVDMMTNFYFAKSHNISVREGYSVAPYHSGVYPAHDMLYNAWKQVWGIKVTSTEEYPALYPSWKRKGFIFKDIMVLPRQTCSLFTTDRRISNFSGGKRKLDSIIHGGEVFKAIINNPINVYMTHIPNYGSDRLALYMFDKLVTFVQKWTNLKLKSEPPIKLAQMYFEMFPHERNPLWTNPCSYNRHYEILPKLQSCYQLPNVLVLGPQKTGTTALHSFMSLHPNIFSNYPSKKTYEELQFFSSTKNYAKGLQWYMRHFPNRNKSADQVLFEKSATYFDNANAPKRAHSLLQNAKLITILIDPAKRAYSWYQHIQAQGNPASMNHTFYDVITSSGPETDSQVAFLRSRCLDPGKYVQHLKRWLQYYPAGQLMVLDGNLLKADPVAAMLKVQHFLQIKNIIDFTNKIRYDAKKGFYCPVKKGRTKCLGENKGRSYRPMDSRSKEYLHQFYQGYNVQLKSYLISIGQPLPSWL